VQTMGKRGVIEKGRKRKRWGFRCASAVAGAVVGRVVGRGHRWCYHCCLNLGYYLGSKVNLLEAVL
jgi:hypothetical protein